MKKKVFRARHKKEEVKQEAKVVDLKEEKPKKRRKKEDK